MCLKIQLYVKLASNDISSVIDSNTYLLDYCYGKKDNPPHFDELENLFFKKTKY